MASAPKPNASVPAAAAAPESTPEPSQSSEITDDKHIGTRYDTILELKQALESTGVECSAWLPDAGVSSASESGWCGQYEWGISIYQDADARNAVVELSDTSMEPQAFLVGPNWLVTRGYEDPADLAKAQAGLGGVLWYPGKPYPN